MMNKRIRALAEQAEFSEKDLHIQGDNFQKFAELILQEVTDVLDREQWDKGVDWVCVDESTIIEKINEHFGVK
jgi:hypothetical protein